MRVEAKVAAYSPPTAPRSMSAAHRSSPTVPASHLPPEQPWSLPSHHQCFPPQNLHGVEGGREQFIQLPARSRKWRSPAITLNSGPLTPPPPVPAFSFPFPLSLPFPFFFLFFPSDDDDDPDELEEEDEELEEDDEELS